MKHRNDLPQFLNEHNLTNSGVEIGCFKGEYSKHIVSNWLGKLYMIDPWRPLGEDYQDISNHKNHIDAYSKSMDSIVGFEDRALMLRGLSTDFVEIFEDNSLDFIYIDGNHAYDYVKKDIEIWYPKVKKGGLISGHDYILLDNWYETDFIENKGKDKHIWSNDGSDKPYSYAGVFGVNTAVDEFCKINNYKLNLTEEFFSTWYFIKK
jgi:hypothetical protein